MRTYIIAALAAVTIIGNAQASQVANPFSEAPRADISKVIVLAQRRSCKAASSCREAVEMWCSGYRRADGDSDGIPCENVCSSRSQVEKLKQEIGC